jgi:hypothetical protein
LLSTSPPDFAGLGDPHKEISLGPDVPLALQNIVKKTLQEDRERRYSDFREINNELTAARELFK